MATASETGSKKGTLAEFLARLAALGDIPAERIRMSPIPGQATEKDVLAVRDGPERLLCELVDGVLVEKAMGSPESFVGGVVFRRLGNYVEEHDLGAVYPADGMFRLGEGLVRLPDVSFVSWDHFPGHQLDMKQLILPYVPDLVVEVISKSNTPAEIDRKLKEYFFAGTRLAWIIDPRKQTAKVYESPETFESVTKSGTLSAAPVLPGFTLALPDLFSRTRKRTG
jgi:Uma2 family endonuclease